MEGMEVMPYFNNGHYYPEEPSLAYQEVSVPTPPYAKERLESMASSVHGQYLILLATLGILTQKLNSLYSTCIYTPAIRKDGDDGGKGILAPIRINDGSSSDFPSFLNELKRDLVNDLNFADFGAEQIFDRKSVNDIPFVCLMLREIHSYPPEDRFLPELLFDFSVADQLSLRIRYNANKFNQDLIYRIADVYFALMEDLVNERAKAIGDIELKEHPFHPGEKMPKAHIPEKREENSSSMPEVKDSATGPLTKMEAELARVWCAVLKIPPGTLDASKSFFELGGHSLKAAVLVNRIRKEFGSAISLKDVFKYRSLSAMADHISRSGAAPAWEILPAKNKKNYALSSSQKRLYFLYELDPESVAYNMPQFVKIDGNLDKERICHTFKKLIERHESLRTRFRLEGNVPVQEISEHAGFEIDWQLAAHPEPLLHSFIRPFDLNKGPVFRVMIVSLNNEEHVLGVDMHHIITDGLSNKLLIADFMKLYVGETLSGLPLRYVDYAEWQQEHQQHAAVIQQKEFWLQEYAEPVNQLILPLDKARPAQRSYNGKTIAFRIAREEAAALRELAAGEEATLYMVLFSVFSILLGRLGSTEDVVIGTPVAGRPHADLEGLIGMFASTLPVRLSPAGNMGYAGFLKEVKGKILKCFECQDYQYEELIKDLKISRDTSRNPLFDVLFVYENYEGGEFQIPGMKMAPYTTTKDVAKFDLTLSAMNKEEGIFLNMNYSDALFSASSIEKFIACFKRIVAAITANREVLLCDIEILDKEEKAELLYTFNDTDAAYFQEGTIIDLFESQVRKTPGNDAVKSGLQTLSYEAFDQLSEKFASYLQKTAGAGPGSLIGILLEREMNLMAAVFGILKAGAAYVPIDPKFPAERINAIIRDSGISALITRSCYLREGISMEDGVLNLDECAEDIYAAAPSTHLAKAGPHDLAYVIYTSGSTGKPKGVMIEHHSLVNRLQWMQKEYPLTESDVILQKTPVVFDVSVWELFWWSFTGASVCLLKPGAEKEPDAIIDAIYENKVSDMHFVPSMLQAFLGYLGRDFNFYKLGSLKKVFSSGEALRPEQVKWFGATLNKNCNTRLINLYGPTEATVDVSFHEIDFAGENTSIPIGRPIDNIRLYILDKYKHLVNKGSLGQLFIGGAGLARGYLGNQSLTREKFIEDPYRPGELIYATGDVARWCENGAIEYLGRIDHQVKIRGFRVDCGEIESNLSAYPSVKESVVLMIEKDNDKYLVAYFVAATAIAPADLRNYLSHLLPSYMVPAYYMQMEAFPLTTSGKLDRKSLPPPLMFADKISYTGATNKTEEKLTEIWSDILGIDKQSIGIEDNFFDIGGHSINIIALSRTISEHFKCAISVAAMFSLPTIKAIGAYLADGGNDLSAMSEEMDLVLDEAALNLNIISSIID